MKEHFIAREDGVKTYILELPAKGIETGPPIICLHGLTRSHKDFESIFATLQNYGRRVFAFDIRGRGNSDWDANPLNYNPLIYTQDVLNACAQLGINRAVFIGTSMGGIISMLIGAYSPQLVEAMLLNDVGPEVAAEGIARIKSYVGSSSPIETWPQAAEAIKKIAIVAFPSKENDEAFWSDFARKTCVLKDGKFVFNYDPAISQGLKSDSAESAAPTLWPQFEMLKGIKIALVRGQLSDILTPQIIDKMIAIKPDLEVFEVPQTGHAPMLDEKESLSAIEYILRN